MKIPLEDFFRNPEKTAYRISPDGSYFSFLAPVRNRMNLFIQSRQGGESKALTHEKDRDIAGYLWADDRHILYVKDTGGDENYKLYKTAIHSGDSQCLTDFPGVRTEIIDELEDIPNVIIIGMNKRNPQVFDPYRLDVEKGTMELLAENPGNIQEWFFDHQGKLRAATAIVDGVNTQLLYRAGEEDPWEVISEGNFKESFSPSFFTFDNQNLYGISNIGRDKSAAVLFDIATQKETVLYANDDYDVASLHYSAKRKVLTAVSFTSWKRERYFFDEETRALFARLESLLLDYELGIASHDKQENIFIVRTYSDRSLGAYYIYEKDSDKLHKIADVSPWLNERDLSSVFPVQFTARDGLELHGYLTLPAGLSPDTAKNLPAVINVHGGPWARDTWTFNPEVQFLANRGYAVLQINFRGSTGYGRRFWELSFKKWGQEMQDDITDGTLWLIERGIADRNRVAIYGGSYGGYATLMGIVKEPRLYAAAIDYVGVSNLFTFMNTIPPYWKPYLDMMYEMVGNPEDKNDKKMMREVSPVFHADKIRTPLFIAQGANDPRVNKDESDQMVEAMKNHHIPVEYLVKENEGHGFHNEENRFDFYRKMERFLSRFLG